MVKPAIFKSGHGSMFDCFGFRCKWQWFGVVRACFASSVLEVQEIPQRLILEPTEFSESQGLLTSSGKLSRAALIRRFLLVTSCCNLQLSMSARPVVRKAMESCFPRSGCMDFPSCLP